MSFFKSLFAKKAIVQKVAFHKPAPSFHKSEPSHKVSSLKQKLLDKKADKFEKKHDFLNKKFDKIEKFKDAIKEKLLKLKEICKGKFVHKPDPETDPEPEQPEDFKCPNVVSEWGDAPIDHLVLHYTDANDNVFSVKVEMAGFDQNNELTDDYFQNCLADLNGYLQAKGIEGIAQPAQLSGLTVVGTNEETQFFELNDSDLTADDVDATDIDYDLLDEDGQTFWNYDFALQGLRSNSTDDQNATDDAGEDEDELDDAA